MKKLLLFLIFLLFVQPSFSQLSEKVKSFVDIPSGIIVLNDALLIDGTGEEPKEHQTVIMRDDKIVWVGHHLSADIPKDAKIIECSGKTIIPGLVMLHEHMFYTKTFEDRFSIGQMSFTFPRLYLAGGVTTARTAGSIQPHTDINIKRQIDAGQMVGPKLDITGPFITSVDGGILELKALENDDEATEVVDYWSRKGATSFKAYMHITRLALKNVVEAAHSRNHKVTGHLCSVTYREAADIGIDNLEHGFMASSDFDKEKVVDECDPFKMATSRINLPENSEEMKELMRHLISKNVAVTSTLNVFEPYTGREIVPGGGLASLATSIKEQVMERYSNGVNRGDGPLKMFKKEMAWEKQFSDMGGLLVVGTDPTGAGRVVPGYANQHTIELLVEAGFSVPKAISVASYNGALYLDRQNSIGTVETGKQADLVIIDGDLLENITTIRKMELVFKDGVGFSSKKLFDSVKGKVGIN